MSAIASDAIYRHGKDRNFTKEEYFALDSEMWAARDKGDMETFFRLSCQLPIHPDVAKAFKEVFGKQYLLDAGVDLTEAEIQFGEGWIDAPNEQ